MKWKNHYHFEFGMSAIRRTGTVGARKQSCNKGRFLILT